MKILAVEFSSSLRSVAVADASGAVLSVSRKSGGRESIALVEEALKSAGVEREEIGILAVGLGPGSYTGIRGALALAQGWQIGRGIKALGISSVDCLAAVARRENIFGEVNIVIDAQRNEFYLARFELAPATQRVIEPLRLASLAEIHTLPANGKLAGPDIATWFPSVANIHPDAAALAQLAAPRTDFVSAEKLEPIYLRQTNFVKAPPPRITAERWHS